MSGQFHELGWASVELLCNLDDSVTHSDVTPALADIWWSSLRGQAVCDDLVARGAIRAIAQVLRHRSFNGAAARATIPGAIPELRRHALMAIGGLTTFSRSAVSMAVVYGIVADICLCMSEHPGDWLIQTWGAGSLSNMFRFLTHPPPDDLVLAVTQLVAILSHPDQNATALCSAAIAARVVASTENGRSALLGLKIVDLLMAAREVGSRIARGSGEPLLVEDVDLTIQCLARISDPGTEESCVNCSKPSPAPPAAAAATRQPAEGKGCKEAKTRAFIVCQCGDRAITVCLACAKTCHAGHKQQSVQIFDHARCECST